MCKDLALLQPYCENNMERLKKMSQSIFKKFKEPLANADYDDFYSLANLTLWQAYNSYNPDMGCFEGFLYSCLQKKFKSELAYRHRKKRVLNQLAVSLDTVNDDGEGFSLLDVIPSDFDTFNEVCNRQGKEQFQNKAKLYISRLSTQQVNILNLLIDGYKPGEIRQILEITPNEYAENLQFMRTYENVKVLF